MQKQTADGWMVNRSEQTRTHAGDETKLFSLLCDPWLERSVRTSKLIVHYRCLASSAAGPAHCQTAAGGFTCSTAATSPLRKCFTL